MEKEDKRINVVEDDIKNVKAVYKFLGWMAGAITFLAGLAKLLIK